MLSYEAYQRICIGTELHNLRIFKEEGRIKAVHKIRIELRPDGRYAVMNVTDELPEEYVEELPPHLRDKLSLMLLMDTDSEAEGLGYRYSQTVFYIDGE